MASSNGAAPPPTTSSAAAASSSTRPDPSAHKTAPDRILIPYNQVGRRSTTLSDTSSTRSILSSSSSASSILPTFRSIQRSHFFQFCATVLLLFIVPLVVLVAYKKEFRSDAFAIGVAAFLASETLRQIVFDLVTPHTATRYRVPAAEYENLVLNDDPRDISSPSIAHRQIDDHDDHDDHEDDGPLPPTQSSPAIPTLVYSIAQEALRLGAVATIVRLLPTEVPLAASSAAAVSHSLIPLPPPSHPSDPATPPSRGGGGGGGNLPPLDPLFWSALWLALGWAGAEILWGSKRLWNQLQLYRDVLPLYPEQVHEGEGEHGAGEREALLGVPTAADYGATDDSNGAREHAYARDDVPVTNADWLEYAARWPHPPRRQDDDLEQGTARQTSSFAGDEEEEEAEWDFEYRVREAQRDELEEQLGVPLYEVPVGIIFIWRLDSLLLSLVFTLFLALPFRLSPPSLFHFPLYPTFALVSLTHALLAYAWVARVRKVGIPSISYASLIVLVALTFAALGSWGVLV
ncbi:hypothetical protein RHOSPDRAFT_35242 [Rhodotorula sp. JG-1b]|nr:hypothetical protein RHOSPDRAFT_35242 [Rhodotorula sp. JG-1b]